MSAHLPGCALSWCKGCDTASLGRPGVPPGAPTPRGGAAVRSPLPAASSPPRASPRLSPTPGASMPAVDVGARDARVLRGLLLLFYYMFCRGAARFGCHVAG